MAGRIPRSFIDDLLARLDIVEIIDARVKLKKKGKNYSACCPFHNEKTPSFSVSQDKQFYHCFGCGVSGNAINFVMEHDRLEFVEAIEELAGHLGLDVPYEKTHFQQRAGASMATEKKRDLYGLLEQVARFYQAELRGHKGQAAIAYLKNRGLSGEVVKRFNIGFVADEWNQVIQRFGQDSVNLQMLQTAGMVVENDNQRRYDRFRGRVMFPIRDKRGRVVGFGGRVLTNDTPKYLNSPETPIFHKGRELYGLYEVLQTEREPDKILVVEGYMDVVALAQFDINYAVAALGTSTSSEHIQALFRQTSTIICCYDGDRAGREAAWRAMENALPHLIDGRQIKFIFLPDGEDPDSMVRKEGKQGFEARLAKAQSLSEFMFATLMKNVDTSSKEGRTKIVSLAQPLIEKLPNGILRGQLIATLGERAGIATQRELEQIIATKKVTAKPVQQDVKRTAMREAIALLLQNPSFAKQVPSLAEMNEMPIPGIQLFNQLLELCHQYPYINTGQLIEYWRHTEHYNVIAKLASLNVETNEENAITVFLDSLVRIIAQGVKHQVDTLQAKDRNIGLTPEERLTLWQLLQGESV